MALDYDCLSLIQRFLWQPEKSPRIEWLELGTVRRESTKLIKLVYWPFTLDADGIIIIDMIEGYYCCFLARSDFMFEFLTPPGRDTHCCRIIFDNKEDADKFEHLQSIIDYSCTIKYINILIDESAYTSSCKADPFRSIPLQIFYAVTTVDSEIKSISRLLAPSRCAADEAVRKNFHPQWRPGAQIECVAIARSEDLPGPAIRTLVIGMKGEILRYIGSWPAFCRWEASQFKSSCFRTFEHPLTICIK